jgi:hypothetical protein
MDKNTTPVAFHIDLTGDNGTPFRFVFLPDDGSVWQYDRRYAVGPDEESSPTFSEDGQQCGGAHSTMDFPATSIYGMRGWHEEDAWDVDVHTRNFVGLWLKRIANAYGLEL